MQALVRDQQHDPPVVMRDVGEPEPAPGEALVEVHTSSLNRGELALLTARPDGWRPGQDIAGVVARPAASGDGPPRGARVLGLVEQGGWAQRVAVPVTRLAPLDDDVSFAVAATLGMAGRTALRTVRLAGDLLGRHVLVLGASGGVGHQVLQLAASSGARVTAQVRDPGHAGGLAALGADRVVVGDDHAAAAYDVIFDGVGGVSLARAVHAVRPHGTIVLFGATDPKPAKLTLLDFIGHEGARILTHFSYASGEEADIAADLATLVALVSRGQLRPTVGTRFDWRAADRALAALAAGQVVGKAVLSIKPEADAPPAGEPRGN